MQKVKAAGLKRMLLEYQEKTVAGIKQRACNIKETSGSTTRRVENRKDHLGGYCDVQEADIDLDLFIIQTEDKKLLCINEALRRLESGQYGYCSDCGNKISEVRLNVLPFAICCRDCEELRESGVKSA